ncbi:hypothetical protein [Caulobacter segnis]
MRLFRSQRWGAQKIDSAMADVLSAVDGSLYPIYVDKLLEQFPTDAPRSFSSNLLSEVGGVISPPMARLTLKGWLSLRLYRRQLD